MPEKLKAAFPNKVILADMKTVDTGAMEVEMAAKSRADIHYSPWECR